MYADGYNQESKNRVLIAIQKRDAELIKKFAKDIKCDRELFFRKNIVGLYVSCKEFSKKLAKQGCFQKKSLTLKFPTKEQVPLHLLNHFIRGYFDGDGCISGKIATITILSTEDFCDKLNLHFSTIIGFKKLENHPNNSITKRYRFGGKNQIRKFYNYIYKDSTIYLERKHRKIKEALSIF